MSLNKGLRRPGTQSHPLCSAWRRERPLAPWICVKCSELTQSQEAPQSAGHPAVSKTWIAVGAGVVNHLPTVFRAFTGPRNRGIRHSPALRELVSSRRTYKWGDGGGQPCRDSPHREGGNQPSPGGRLRGKSRAHRGLDVSPGLGTWGPELRPRDWHLGCDGPRRKSYVC